ncbi:hypothetical protein DOY81_003608, partial [Sarcophaga bullata]
MKLKSLGDLVVFDTFPLLYEPKQKIIITHLLHLEEQPFPYQLPMIFTTHKIAEQLRKYCEFKKLKCLNKSNIVVVKPYEFIDIVVDRRQTLQILFCASEVEESNNVIVLIKENGKLNYIYAGNFVDIRSAVLNDTFAAWIANGVENLYVNLKRMDENHIFNEIDLREKTFNIVEDIMKCHRNSRIHICLPLFGYENFIIKLSQRFPNRINCRNLKEFYINCNEDDPVISTNFCTDNEKIILHTHPLTSFEANMRFKKSKEITINILNDASKVHEIAISSRNFYYELFYTPEPSPFQLKLLTMLVKPKRIFGIVDTFNNKSIVPSYLYEYCVGAKENLMRKQANKLSQSSSASVSTQPSKQTLTKTIIAGALSNKETRSAGPYLSDSDNDAGKTTILYKLKQNDEIKIIPTIGYNVETVDFEDKTFTFWDIGGLESVRVLWKFYTENKAAVIFVIDASNAQRFPEAKEFLHSIMNNEDLANAVLLIISNKHDKQNSHDELHLQQQLDLNNLKRSYDIINTKFPIMAARRDIAPFLQRLRAFLLGREHTVALRFEDGVADRTQPPPDVPGGPAHVLSANYYVSRDPRRLVEPPIDLVKQTLLTGDKDAKAPAKLPTPGA